MGSPGWLTWHSAWTEALYGRHGFYLTAQPDQHFRTSSHVSPLFATAIVTLVRRLGLDAVTDYGAGSGELLGHLHDQAPDLHLTGIELRPRPPGLPPAIRWSPLPPPPDTPKFAPSGRRVGHTLASRAPAERRTTLLIANEVLDNVPCDVVELDAHHVLRIVEVEPASGEQRLGQPAPCDVVSWVEQWWPCERVGQQVEVGLARDEWWAALCLRQDFAGCLAVDYGHLRDERPAWTTLSSYRHGRQTAVSLDGHHDVTAHVAFDSLAARVGGRLSTQRDALRQLGIDGRRPPLSMAAADPSNYVRALARATQAAELTASPGLGSFFWLFSSHSDTAMSPPSGLGRADCVNA